MGWQKKTKHELTLAKVCADRSCRPNFLGYGPVGGSRSGPGLAGNACCSRAAVSSPQACFLSTAAPGENARSPALWGLPRSAE